jgi:hypothetical protein
LTVIDKKSSSKTSRNADPEASASRATAADTATKASQGPEQGQGQGIRGFRDGVASEGTPYRIAVGTFEPSANDREVDETDKDIWSPHSATETSDTVHSTGSDTEGASSAEESEGSLEDAIASMSGKIDRSSATVPATATALSEDGAATDTTSASSTSSNTQQSTASGSGAESANKLKSDAVSVGVVVGSISVSSLGSGLPINVREALRYRIRKKM